MRIAPKPRSPTGSSAGGGWGDMFTSPCKIGLTAPADPVTGDDTPDPVAGASPVATPVAGSATSVPAVRRRAAAQPQLHRIFNAAQCGVALSRLPALGAFLLRMIRQSGVRRRF